MFKRGVHVGRISFGPGRDMGQRLPLLPRNPLSRFDFTSQHRACQSVLDLEGGGLTAKRPPRNSAAAPLGLLEKAREFLRPRTSQSERPETTKLVEELRAELARLTAEGRKARTKLEELERRISRLKTKHATEIAKLKAEHAAEVAKLKTENERLHTQLHGRRSEKLPNDKDDDEAGERKPRQRPRRGHGRKPISPALEVVTTTLELPEDQRCCPDCGDTMKPFGDDEVTDQVAHRTAAFYVKRTVRKKYRLPKVQEPSAHASIALDADPKGPPGHVTPRLHSDFEVRGSPSPLPNPPNHGAQWTPRLALNPG